jgi:single-stranded-DNA-specific exonuclease
LINSSARMGEIELAFQILMVDNDTDAKKLRLKMDKLNKKRQETQKAVMQKYEDTQNMEDKIVIVIDSESNKGMNGLVAQNIAQKYRRPCFVVTEGKDGVCRGSGRSYGGFNTNEFLSELDFVEAQGHGQAHGLNFPLDRLDDLKEYIEENMPDNLETEQTFYYDIELENVEEAFMALTDLININYITGNNFPEVVVRMDNVMIEERAVIGKTKETVKFKTSGDLVFIKFKVNEDWNKDIDTFDTVSVVGNGTINEFYNFGTKEMTRTPQIIIMDIVKD